MTIRELFPSVRSLSALLSAQRTPASFAVGRRTGGDRQDASLAPLRPRIEIPVRDPEPAANAAARLRARGQFLARQDDWEQLAVEVREADTARALTAGLQSEAVLLCEGARRDITEAVAEGVERGASRIVQEAVASLEPLLSDLPSCPVIAHIVAMAHVDAARAWRGASLPGDLAPEPHAAYARHMAAASRLNDRFDPFEHETPLWALVRCAVLEADPQPHTRVADDFEDLIDLDPGNPHHLLAFGSALRPARFGSWEMLDTQARRTAARTADVWGAGGYAWVCLGALREDPGAFRRLDAELCVEGLHDILGRHPTQDMTNRIAALVGHTLGGGNGDGGAHSRLAECLGWIAQDHLREVHPLLWAEAPARRKAPLETEANPARVGRARALAALTEFYAPALDSGRRLVFGTDGMRIIKDD